MIMIMIINIHNLNKKGKKKPFQDMYRESNKKREIEKLTGGRWGDLEGLSEMGLRRPVVRSVTK